MERPPALDDPARRHAEVDHPPPPPIVLTGRRHDDAETGTANLFRSDHLAMARLAHRLTGSEPAAREIASDAYVEVHRRWSGLDDPTAELRACVVRRSISHARHRTLRRRWRAGTAGAQDRSAADPTWRDLAGLRPRHRAALVLRFSEDLSLPEVAAALGCRAATARWLVHRGLRQVTDAEGLERRLRHTVAGTTTTSDDWPFVRTRTRTPARRRRRMLLVATVLAGTTAALGATADPGPGPADRADQEVIVEARLP